MLKNAKNNLQDLRNNCFCHVDMFEQLIISVDI